MTDHARPLNINEDFQEDFAIEKRATTTSDLTEAAGLTLTARFALTKTGAAIGAPTITVTELSGEAGTYRVECDTAALVTALTAYVRRRVFLILTKAGDMDCVWQEYKVTDNREVED